MDKALNEIGKLRNEMKIGFIELENQIEASNDRLINQMKENTSLFVKSMENMSENVEKGFLAIEDAIE